MVRDGMSARIHTARTCILNVICTLLCWYDGYFNWSKLYRLLDMLEGWVELSLFLFEVSLIFAN